MLHKKAHEGEDESKAGVRITRSMAVRSLALGISGECDIVEFHNAGGDLKFEISDLKGRASGTEHEASGRNLRSQISDLKFQISNLKPLAESCSRQIRAWADSLQNSDIKGPRHLNEQTRGSWEKKKDSEERSKAFKEREHEMMANLPQDHPVRMEWVRRNGPI